MSWWTTTIFRNVKSFIGKQFHAAMVKALPCSWVIKKVLLRKITCLNMGIGFSQNSVEWNERIGQQKK